MNSTRRKITYRINAADELIEITGPWDAFAAKNDGPNLTAESVLRRNLFDFVVGEEIGEVYRGLLNACRQHQKTLFFPFRCDGPQMRRYLTMTMIPHIAGEVEFQSLEFKTEPRPVVHLLDEKLPREKMLLRICSWCKKIAVEGPQWLEAEEAITRLALFSKDHLPRMTHSICPDCNDHMMRLAN